MREVLPSFPVSVSLKSDSPTVLPDDFGRYDGAGDCPEGVSHYDTNGDDQPGDEWDDVREGELRPILGIQHLCVFMAVFFAVVVLGAWLLGYAEGQP